MGSIPCTSLVFLVSSMLFAGDIASCYFFPAIKEATCPDQAVPEHSQVNITKQRWTVGDTISYTCAENYRLLGKSEATCQSDKQWSSQPPLCVEIDCQVNRPRFGWSSSRSRFTDPNYIAVGGTLTYTCDNNYEMENQKSGELTVTCLANRQWSQELPTCLQIDCQVNRPRFGWSSSRSRFTDPNYIAVGGTLTYTCDNNYEMENQESGQLTVTCLANRQWSQELPTCLPIQCIVPNLPRSTLVSPPGASFLVNDVITYTCADRYRMTNHPNGEVQAICRKNSSWSRDVPTCVEIDCRVNRPLFGWSSSGSRYTNPNYIAVGGTLIYTCNNDYEMENQESGELTVTCQTNRQWSRGLPTCLRKRLCGNVIFSADVGVNRHFTSPNYPNNYTSFLSCTYHFRAPDENYRIRFQVNTFSTENEQDILKFFGSGIPSNDTIPDLYLGRRNVKKGFVWYSDTSSVVALLNIDPSTSNKRFDILFTAIQDGCGDMEYFAEVDVNKTFKSPFYPQPYSNLLNCFYQFKVPRDDFQISFHINYFYTEGCCDKLKFYDSEFDSLHSPPFNLSGFRRSGALLDSKTNVMTVQFSSDQSVIERGFNITFTAFKDYSKCGQSDESYEEHMKHSYKKILGGHFSSEYMWPWQAIVTVFQAKLYQSHTGKYSFLGGASVINHQWLLSATHVVVNTEGKVLKNLIFTLGISSLVTRSKPNIPSYARVFAAEIIFPHKNYSAFDYDVALIKLGKEYNHRGEFLLEPETDKAGWIDFSVHIRPVCLPCMENNYIGDILRKEGLFNGADSDTEKCNLEMIWLLSQDKKSRENMKIVASGFGVTHPENEFPSEVLKHAFIELKNHSRCVEASQQMLINWEVTEQMLCGVGDSREHVTDTCYGDSGGPLVRKVRHEGKTYWIQVGITSWGFGCGKTYEENRISRYFPGYYTNVAKVMPWIKLILNSKCLFFKLDVMFLLDSFGFETLEYSSQVKSFVKEAVKTLKLEHDNVGVIKYSQRYKQRSVSATQRHFQTLVELGQHSNQIDFENAVDGFEVVSQTRMSDTTCSGQAIKNAVKSMMRSRRNCSKKAIIVVTGKTSTDRNFLRTTSNKARESGIALHAVGINQHVILDLKVIANGGESYKNVIELDGSSEVGEADIISLVESLEEMKSIQ